MKADIDQRIMDWTSVQAQLAHLKAREMEMRKDIAAELFPDPDEGTNTYELGKGYKLKLKHTLRRTIDEAVLPSVLERLPHAEACIKNKPELVIKQYKKLQGDDLLIFEECLITKPGSPSLELVVPKDPENG